MSKLCIVFVLLLACLTPMAVHAFQFDAGGSIKDALQLTDKDAKRTTVDIVRYSLSLVGLIAVVMIIYGGVRYMTSGGNQDVVQNARAVLKWAMIGLLIIILSQVILTAVVDFV